MCPSYMVTREEKHTTRGRAHLLFEMLRGDPLQGGWQDENVKEALDLCLACKGCRGECPVAVDMATYKAEFLAHYYEARRRPRTAYAFGLIARWAALAEMMPRLVNFVTQTPGLQTIAKLTAGMAGERKVPAFAPSTFRAQFAGRTPLHREGARRVILWPDTFNDHFRPETLMAAVEVLEASGFLVEIPRARLCCGRPLYDYGFLAMARAHLQEIMRSLGNEIDQGIPIVVLEPSCAAVFQDELLNLFPDEQRARRLSEQVFSLGALLEKDADRLPAVTLRRKALVHGHCHQNALGKMEPETSLLRRLAMDLEALDSGCCGMAGSFGFEGKHFEISHRIGERVLLPAVRQASRDTLIVANGFSCREQIAQLTGRRALHLADVLKMAMTSAPHGPAGDYPERVGVTSYEHEIAISGRTAALLGAGAAALGLAFAVSRPFASAPGLSRVRNSSHAETSIR